MSIFRYYPIVVVLQSHCDGIALRQKSLAQTAASGISIRIGGRNGRIIHRSHKVVVDVETSRSRRGTAGSRFNYDTCLLSAQDVVKMEAQVQVGITHQIFAVTFPAGAAETVKISFVQFISGVRPDFGVRFPVRHGQLIYGLGAFGAFTYKIITFGGIMVVQTGKQPF
jgi:hypothetical protein